MYSIICPHCGAGVNLIYNEGDPSLVAEKAPEVDPSPVVDPPPVDTEPGLIHKLVGGKPASDGES